MYKRSRTSDSEATEVYRQGSLTASRRRRSLLKGMSRKSIYRRYKVPSTLIYPFERTTRIQFTLNNLTGFIGASSDRQIALSFGLEQTGIWYVNAGISSDITNPGYTDFTNLFDQYRINRVELKFIWQANTSEYDPSNQTQSRSIAPLMHMATDYDDSGVFSLDQLLQYPNCRTIQLGQINNAGPIHVINNPGVVVESQTDLLTPLPSTMRRSPWCDCAVPNVKHNGLKISWDSMGQDFDLVAGNLIIMVKYSLEFKNAR